jgi:hypothetical protein
MSSPKSARRKCANEHCHRHVHGNAARQGVRHCRPCIHDFRYAYRVARERDVGIEVGNVLAKFFVPRGTAPNNPGVTR